MREADIGYLLKNLNDKMKIKADADLKSYNLTFTQSRVCAFLEDCRGQATQKEIEVFLNVSHPTVVGIVSRLEQNGYVETYFDENDKRNKIVKLTRRAVDIGEEMQKHISENEKNLLSSLSQDEIRQLKRLLLVLYGNLE